MCDTCRSFREFYTGEESALLLEDIGVAELLSNTEDTPRFRGESQVRMINNKVIEVDEGKIAGDRLEFSVKANPSFEPAPQKVKKGYIEYYYKNKKLILHRLYCTCSYFTTRCHYALVKGDNATWDIGSKYLAIERKRKGIKVNNRQPAKKMNPRNIQRICKHIFFILNDENYIPWASEKDSEIIEKKPIEKKTKEKPIEKPEVKKEPVKKIELMKKELPKKIEVPKKELPKKIEVPKKVEPIKKVPEKVIKPPVKAPEVKQKQEIPKKK